MLAEQKGSFLQSFSGLEKPVLGNRGHWQQPVSL